MTPALTLPGQMDRGVGDRLKSAISSYVSQSVRPVNDVDKVYWNNQLRRNKLYYEGKQNLAYGWGASGIPDYVNVTGQSSMGLRVNPNNQQWVADYVLNFFQGDVDTFVAVIGARSPNVQSKAKDESNDDHVRMKMKADRTAQWLQSSWNVELLHPLLVKGLAIFGTMFSYTRYAVNPMRYGYSQTQAFKVEEIPMGPAYYQCWNCGMETTAEEAQALVIQAPGLPPDTVPCSQCGTPLGIESLIQPETISSLVPNNLAPLANGAVELSIYNSSYVTTDMDKRNLDYAMFLLNESEEDKGVLAQAYPELREKIYADNYTLGADQSQAMGAYTRQLLVSPTGQMVNQRKNRWLHSLLWIAPSAFEYLPNDRSGELRDLMLKKYSDGAKVPLVNGEVMMKHLENERLTSVWAACTPKPSESIYAPAYFDCMVQIQDVINDSNEMASQQMQRSNPFVITDPEIVNPEMIQNSSSSPGQFIFAKPGSVGTLDRGFFRVPGAELNPVLFNYISQQLSWCREMTGIVPAIFGGSDDGGDKTKFEVETRRNQAMQKLGVPWNQIRMFWAATYENGIYQAAKYSGSKLFQRSSRGGVESMEMEGIWELLQGGWFMQCEESTPMTVGQRRDAIMKLATGTSPEFQAGMGLKDPNNLQEVQEAWGIPGWKIPGYSEVQSLHGVINQLTKGQPTLGQPGPPDPMTGMPGPPGPPQPSIQFDPFLYEPQMALQVIKEWLLSDKGQQTMMDNVPGYQNVLAYGHSVAEQVPPPQPEQKGPTLAIAASLGEMTPDMQQAVAKTFGIQAPPGLLALPKPAPKPLGAGPDGPPPEGPPPDEPPNELAEMPPGAMLPQDAELAGAPN
jgi:hypothetical protein